MDELAKLLATLDLPEGLKTQIRELQPKPVAHVDVLTRRLSLLRTFTRRGFEVAAKDLESAPAFETFTATAAVDPIIGYPGRLSIAERVRSQHLAQWHNEPEECARWARALAESLDPADPVEKLDRLQVLFLADQDEARRALSTAFEAADRANDIAQCSALVQLVATTIQLFGDERSRALCDQIRSRSQSRNLFFSEFYQSQKYFQRPIDRQLRSFAAAADEKWIFHLHATGGMGKTTLLRRLISHEWIMGPRHCPCAFIDFDYLEVSTVLQQPALLGLAMAAQWNEQLEQPVFGSFLISNFQPLASLLFRNRSDASARGLSSEAMEQRFRNQYRAGQSNPMRCGMLAGAVPPRSLEERTQRMSQTSLLFSYWMDKLPEALAAMPVDRPVLLVLDTLEDASQPHGQQLLATLRLIAGLRQQAHKLANQQGRAPVNLRLILSGRHQLGREHVAEFTKEFESQCIEQPLPGLEAAEAGQFLDAEIRSGVHQQHRTQLIDVMVKKSEGIPFNLSLFAEWANGDENLNVDTVRQSEDVSTVMLIERIVKRIPYQPLRWIIRYGVVPRILSFDYLRDVMREPLLDALSGRASASGTDTPTSATEWDVWLKEPGFEFDLMKLWDQYVLPYTNERSWIMPGEQPQQVSFRADILQPMRRLLRKQPIFELLHQRSSAWFSAQAGEPGKWNTALIECLYHSVQLRGIPGRQAEDFLPGIRRMLDGPVLRQNAPLRMAVCEELCKPDFSELTRREQVYVRYRLAEAIGAAHESYTTPEAVSCLREAIDLAGNEYETVLPAFADVWEMVADGTTLSQVISALKDLPPDELVRATLLVAEISDAGSNVVNELLAKAITLNEQSADPPVPTGVVSSRLAQRLKDIDPESAVAHFTSAALDYGSRGDQARRSDLLQTAAGIEIDLGRLQRAESLLTQPDLLDTPAVRLQRARLCVAKGNPGEALNILNDGRYKADADSVDALVVQSEALSQRMLLLEATLSWDSALSLASKQSASSALNRIAVGQAKLYFWWFRVAPDVAPEIAHWFLRRPQMKATIPNDASVTELEVWQVIYGRRDRERWRRRAAGELGGNTPATRVRLILALTKVMQPLPAKRWTELLEQATKLSPGARTAALAEPVLEGNPPALDPQIRSALADVFRHEPEGEIERAWYGVRYGEFLAWLGLHEDAVKLLTANVPVLDEAAYGHGWRAAVYRQRRRIEQRIRDWRSGAGHLDVFPRPDPDPADLWGRFWGHTPFRAAAALVENAQRAHEADQPRLMQDCLDRAKESLATVQLETAFHVTARRLGGDAAEASLRVPDRDRSQSAEQTLGSIAPDAPVFESIAIEDPEFRVVEMREQSGRIAVSFAGTAGAQVISPESRTLEILLRSRGIPRRLTGFPIETIIHELEEFLWQADINFSAPLTGLKIPLSPLSCAPWELTSSDLDPPFRLPSAWKGPDLALEAQDPASYRPFPPDQGPVLLQPLSPQDRESPALPCYLALPSQIPRRLDESKGGTVSGHVLYVASGFIEIPNLDEPALGGLEWMATTLAATISRTFLSFRPLVILDTPVAATPGDFVHQLLLRNYFAQALVDSGLVSGVLATGLHPLEGMVEMQRNILAAVADPVRQQLAVFDQITRSARAAGLRPHDALFTATPYGPLIARNPYG